MSLELDNQGVGEDVSASLPGDSATSASLSNEPSATTADTDLNTGVEGSPTSLEGQLEIKEEGESSLPVDLTEQEIASLAPKTAQAFARFRTENKGLGEENASLKQQLAEIQSQPKSTTPSIVIDNPVEDWKGLDQFEALPAPYKEKLGDEIGWRRLPDLISRASENFEELPQEWKDAIGHPILTAIGREFGLTPAGVIQAIQAGIGQTEDGEQQFSTSTAQGLRSQNSGLTKQLIESGGYEATDPIVQGVAGLERNMALIQRENQALRSRLDNHDQQQQASSKEQTERTQRQLETDFQAKAKATWDTVLTPTLQTIPQGYEQMRRMASADAKEALANDSVAQTHLTNAKSALVQAQKYRNQGTPELASQAEDRHSREMTAYAARIAVVAQPIVKEINSLIAENVRLKNGVTQEQQQRKDIIGGSGANGNGNGFQPKQPGEDMDAYLARAREYRMQEIAHHDSQR